MIISLNSVLQSLNSANSLNEALMSLIQYSATQVSAQAYAVYLIDADKGEYILSATDGLKPTAVGKCRVALGKGVVGQIIEREEPVNIDDFQSHPNYHRRPMLEESGFHGFLGVPVIHQGETLGVIAVYQQATEAFSEDDVAFLTTLSAQVSHDLAQVMARGAIAQLVGGRRRKKKEVVLLGLSGAEGVAIGKAMFIYPPADLDAVPDQAASDVGSEIEHFEQALAMAREEISELQQRAQKNLSVAESALFDAYLRILDSRSLMNEVEEEIRQGLWAQAALRRVISHHAIRFESLSDDYMKERAADFRDLGRRILSHLQANKRHQPDYPKNTILVSEEVTATMLMEVPDKRLVGIISGSGSSNSHVAILARALGIPTVMGVTGTSIMDLSGHELIVDGYNGQIYLSPTPALKKEFLEIAEEEQQFDEGLATLRDLPATTEDDHTIRLLVNTGLAIEGSLSLRVGADGVGLYRTEMPFMLRDRFPSEEEQRVMYRQLLNTFAPKPVVMRTLDIGGDKALPYFPVVEDNPFLGWRGIRVTLDHPELFLQQVRAMLAASEGLDNLSIMLPMISSVGEVESAERLIQQAYHELLDEGKQIRLPALGVMIEVPAAVYQAHELAKRVDFISVGTNDLVQYLLAVDRNNPRVATIYNALHPAVLRALQQIVKAAHKAGKPVSVCGEMASDPVTTVLLLGMGFDALSMSARALLRVKWAIRNFSYEKAQALVKEVLKIDDPIEVRVHLEMALETANLGSIIRAGR